MTLFDFGSMGISLVHTQLSEQCANVAEVDAILSKWLEPEIVVATAIVANASALLFPAELMYVSRCVESRRNEFGTARVLARAALRQLGIEVNQPLLPHADRSPYWPDEVIGSISHSGDLCAVTVGLRSSTHGIGIDIECLVGEVYGLEDLICCHSERMWLSSLSSELRENFIKVFFCIKEAIYKMQYPLTKRFLEWTDVEVEIDLVRGTFSIASPIDAVITCDMLSLIKGVFHIGNTHVIAVARLMV